MAKNENDIRSTEKLLDLIRNADTANAADKPGDAQPTAIPSARAATAPAISFRKQPTVGIDIGHTHLKLAKVVPHEKRFLLIDYRDIPFNTSISLSDPDFLKRLKDNLDQFCKSRGACRLWGAIQSANVEIRSLQIPKLPRKQLSNAIFWTFTKHIAFDPQTEVMDYQILGDITVDGIKKTDVIAFKAPRNDVETYKRAFQKIGYPLDGITIVPFAIQNLFRRQIIPQQQKDVCCLFVGRDWSRIAIYNNGNLVLSRGIKAGMRSMIEAVNVAVNRDEDWQDGPGAVQMKDTGRNYAASAIDPRAQQIFFDYIANKIPKNGSAMAPGISQAAVFKMLLPALERLVRQVERTFEHYAIHYNRDGVGQIFISGQVIANSAMLDYLAKQLGLPVIPMNPFPPDRQFVREVRIPERVSDREAYVPAIGLALSSNAVTPNFLHTHKDRDSAERVRRINMRILTSCMLILMVMIGLFSWQQNQLDLKREDIAKLDHRLIAYSPPADREVLLALFAKTKAQRKSVSDMVRRYTPLALISELSSVTPANVRLIRIDVNFDNHRASSSTQGQRGVIVEGIIFGDPSFFETALTGYMLNLKNSPMFKKPNVRSKQVEYYDRQEVLRFTTSLEIV